ncbi:hypothetical protein KUCAC02_009384 [Chaenocephalus aceratus]|uniref:Uncharacterized protein n=1 Tax=Chaenocephalus aceratus TaxID=36190 RepID=A0ACB9WU35_CHAAC|nr:hypothetical protein KUCAC02_009384 [Chaenocephalus aceratus]
MNVILSFLQDEFVIVPRSFPGHLLVYSPLIYMDNKTCIGITNTTCLICNHTILSCQDTLPSGELKKVQKASLTLQASLDALFPPMFLTVDVCKAKWKSLRDAFVKTRKKSIPSGSAGGSQKAWKYSDIMSFLLPYIQQRSSTSSLGNPSPLEEIERASTPGAASGYSGPRTPRTPHHLQPHQLWYPQPLQRGGPLGPVAPRDPHQQRQPSVPQRGGHRAQTLGSN